MESDPRRAACSIFGVILVRKVFSNMFTAAKTVASSENRCDENPNVTFLRSAQKPLFADLEMSFQKVSFHTW